MVIIIGPPGAGKSMQASLLDREGIAIWLSMGKLLREALTGDQKAKQNKGDLIDIGTTGRVLRERLQKINEKDFVILDGFPRTNSQVEWLFSDENPRQLDGVLYIDVPEEEAIHRLHLRKREDDTDEVIQHRYDIFHHENQPILDHLVRRGVAIEKVDGNATIEEVHERVKQALQKLSGYR